MSISHYQYDYEFMTMTIWLSGFETHILTLVNDMRLVDAICFAEQSQTVAANELNTVTALND